MLHGHVRNCVPAVGRMGLATISTDHVVVSESYGIAWRVREFTFYDGALRQFQRCSLMFWFRSPGATNHVLPLQ